MFCFDLKLLSDINQNLKSKKDKRFFRKRLQKTEINKVNFKITKINKNYELTKKRKWLKNVL